MAKLRFIRPAPLALAASLLIVTCCQSPAPGPVATQQPAPRPVATTAPAPQPMPAPQEENWIDRAQTPGDWSYRQEQDGVTVGDYRSPSGKLLLQMACVGGREVFVSVPGAAPGPLTIRTETGSRTQTATASEIFARTRLDPRDPLLDAMAITKGRFAVEAVGVPGLYLPSWAEVTRVIEDCR